MYDSCDLRILDGLQEQEFKPSPSGLYLPAEGETP